MARKARNFEVVPLANVIGKAEVDGCSKSPANSEENTVTGLAPARTVNGKLRQKNPDESLLDKMWIRGGAR